MQRQQENDLNTYSLIREHSFNSCSFLFLFYKEFGNTEPVHFIDAPTTDNIPVIDLTNEEDVLLIDLTNEHDIPLIDLTNDEEMDFQVFDINYEPESQIIHSATEESQIDNQSLSPSVLQQANIPQRLPQI